MNEMKNSVEDKKDLSPQVSVIIPFHGSNDELLNCLKGLMKQKTNINFEVIVVESGNDLSAKYDLNSFHNVKWISSQEVMYPGKARNIGVANSSSYFLAFIDADCVPSSNWLSEMYLSLNTGCEIVIGPITNLYPFHPVASVDNLLQFPDFQKHRSSSKITHFPGCNLGMTRGLFNKTGGFPENIITGEDVKFSESAIRICENKISFNSKLIVQHSGRKNLKFFIKHNVSLGFHRGYLNLKISSVRNKYRGTFLHAFLFGIRRLVYISIRTLQWNPISLFRIIFYFPIVILGLSAWVIGSWRGNQKFMEEQN
jgi:GT2 family glycosyltransferase